MAEPSALFEVSIFLVGTFKMAPCSQKLQGTEAFYMKIKHTFIFLRKGIFSSWKPENTCYSQGILFFPAPGMDPL